MTTYVPVPTGMCGIRYRNSVHLKVLVSSLYLRDRRKTLQRVYSSIRLRDRLRFDEYTCIENVCSSSLSKQ